MKNWFKDWFDSEYYDELYQERDMEEADRFIESLLERFHITESCKVLDVACGNGRHAKALVNRGITVTGIDLSTRKILEAKLSENENLNFFQHDMRKNFMINYFDYVLNLFTSFGYFDSDKENKMVASSLATNLKKGGILIIDYFNKSWVVDHLVTTEDIIINGNEYHIERRIESNKLIKDIVVCTGTTCQTFQERVKIFTKNELVNMFESVGLQLIEVFGNYQLDRFDRAHSPRMICAFIKK